MESEAWPSASRASAPYSAVHAANTAPRAVASRRQASRVVLGSRRWISVMSSRSRPAASAARAAAACAAWVRFWAALRAPITWVDWRRSSARCAAAWMRTCSSRAFSLMASWPACQRMPPAAPAKKTAASRTSLARMLMAWVSAWGSSPASARRGRTWRKTGSWLAPGQDACQPLQERCERVRPSDRDHRRNDDRCGRHRLKHPALGLAPAQ